ncbi:Dephospho-CoA kinase [Trypanosoma melophagium]|uniref:Dephospho-CoA kinase n=1 Tax=Trypanosoma melophagium TaxID=715481 RepID=UPI00351A300C|nr:Dephospho-CoA kinase [Trypanosoma melophagium]
MLHSSRRLFSVTQLPRVVVLGMTGGIASGKSVRCRHLLRLAEARSRQHVNSFVTHSVNADRIGHCIYAPGMPCYYAVINAFGKEILAEPFEGDGNNTWNTASPVRYEPPIDRKKLGAIVFHEPRSKELQKLSNICWPHIHEAIEEEIENVSNTALSNSKHLLLIILEAALLVESSLIKFCDDVWITECNREVALKRIITRDYVSEEEAMNRVDTQLSIEEKLRFLSDIKFKGSIVRFDSTTETLEEGLKRVASEFDKYWRHKLDPLQKNPGAESRSWDMN